MNASFEYPSRFAISEPGAMLVPTELRRIVRLALALAMIFTTLGPVSDSSAAPDLYPGAPALVNSPFAPFASIKSEPDPTTIELAQIDNGTPADIVTGPLTGADGMLWYQITIAGIIGYIAETDLAWGTPPDPTPIPAEAPALPVVTGNGIVLSVDNTEIGCRIEPRTDADLLFSYPSGSAVDLAGQPVDGWQPVLCAAQLGYLPAELVFDPANLPAPVLTETPEITPDSTEIIPEVTEIIEIPESTETIDIPEETPLPEIVETVVVETESPSTTETVVTETETPVITETVIEPIGTPEIVETITEESVSTTIPAPTDESESTTTPTESSTTSTPATTWIATEIVEVTATVEPIGQTIADEDLSVMPAALANAAAVYNTGGGGLRCRVGPSLDARILLVLPLGAPVALTGLANDGWQPVNCNGQNGYMAVRYLQATDGGTISQGPVTAGGVPSGVTVIVQNTENAGLRCRSAANLSASVITVIPEGTTLSSRGTASNGWQPVTCAGNAGWVHTDFIGNVSQSGSTSGGVGGTTGTATGSATVANTGGDGVRFRSGASFDSSVIAVLMEGAAVTLRNGSIGSWTAVSSGGRDGFIYADYLATARNPSLPGTGSGVGSTALSAGSNARVTDNLNFRGAPSYSGGVVGVAAVGTVVRITGAASSGFYPVKWADTTGYMHGDYLVYTTEALSTIGPNGSNTSGNLGGGPGAGNSPGSAIGQSMVAYAMRYLGYPYVWATHGPNSFDCSGFTYWVVLNVAGRDISAGTWPQWETGAPVQYGSLQPGDLVFFQNTDVVGLSHVGMYIGNDQFIHAENENTGVRISSLTSTYYATRYLGARRVA